MGDSSNEPGLGRAGAPLAVAGIGGCHRRGGSLRAVGHTGTLVQAPPDRMHAEFNEEEKAE